MRDSIARTVLVLQWIAVSVIILITILAAGLSWQHLLSYQRIVKLAELDRILFGTVTKSRVEIGTVGVALIQEPDPRKTVESALANVAQLYDTAVASLSTSGLKNVDDLLLQFRDVHQHLIYQEKVIFAELEKPIGQRDVSNIEPWRQTIYAYADVILGASNVVGTQLRTVDNNLSDLVTIRELSYAIRDRYARQCSRFRPAVQKDRPLTALEKSHWREDVGAYRELWNGLDRIASHYPDGFWLKQSVFEGKKMTFKSQSVMDRVIYGLSGSGKPAYDAKAWSDNCLDAYSYILSIGYNSLDDEVAYAEEKRKNAVLLGALSTIVLLVSLAFGFFTVRFVRLRLSSPLGALASDVARMNKGNFEIPVQTGSNRSEMFVIAEALERLRNRSLEEMRLNRRINEMRIELIDYASRMNHAKSAFLARMSHEIRTPLNGILGTAQLLKQSKVTGEQRQWLDALTQSGNLLRQLLDDLLDYSRIECGRTEVEEVPFSLNEQIRAAEATILSAAHEKNLSYKRIISPCVPDGIIGDPAKLVQILQNLLSNAVKFTPEGEITLSVDLIEKVSKDFDHSLEIVVKDTGIGIVKQAQATLFEPFTQADSSMVRRFGGSGMGLAICKGYLDLLGGTISVDCPEEGGTIFTVHLPISFDERCEDSRHTPPEEFELSPLHILVAEDDPVNAMIVRTILEKAGHRIDLVSNGLEAVHRASLDIYDVILMDLSMSGLDGIEAARRIRSLDDEIYSMVPIVAVTADLMIARRLNVGEVLFDGFVGKPYALKELEHAIAVSIGLVPRRAKQPSGTTRLSPLTEQAQDLGIEGAHRVLELFLSEMPGLADSLFHAAQAGHDKEASALAHRMKGASGQVGAEWVHRLAEAAEKAANIQDQDELVRLATEIRTDLDQNLVAFITQSTEELKPFEKSVTPDTK
nr:ATP-binding protein [uncultured Cohaesibacter sp.]